MTNKSTITVDVFLDKDKVPEQLAWTANPNDGPQPAKAMLVSFWDGAEKTALHIDLWTKDMMVDEMADFFYQTVMGMSDTFERATHNHELVHDMKHFAKNFIQKFRDQQAKEGKANL